jgi:decaprenyl-phosphate phosphoribosyltransferase
MNKPTSNESLVEQASPTGEAAVVRARPSGLAAVLPYVKIARPDHWFKNVFMLAGVMLALFYYPASIHTLSISALVLAFAATCLIASSNYVINEVLDARTDRDHPVKRRRPIPSGLVLVPIACAEWLLLAAGGLGLAWLVNVPFFFVGLSLWIMGMVYNVRPIRSKDLPYLDVISESVNNPIRLIMGWFVVSAAAIPPMSLLGAYWLVGAFFMATKRFAEYRSLGDKETAAAYRNSFRHYDDDRLLISMFFYASGAALLLGVFIIRYHLELILTIPLIAGFFAYYLKVALKDDSAVQNPERLYRESGLMLYLVACVCAFVGLMFVEIPLLYDVFNIEPSHLPALWRVGS